MYNVCVERKCHEWTDEKNPQYDTQSLCNWVRQSSLRKSMRWWTDQQIDVCKFVCGVRYSFMLIEFFFSRLIKLRTLMITQLMPKIKRNTYTDIRFDLFLIKSCEMIIAYCVTSFFRSRESKRNSNLSSAFGWSAIQREIN